MKKNETDRTRDVIAKSILEGGPATAANLAEKLNLTAAGIRRHLDSLVEDGILESREEHVTALHQRGRGRPSRVFRMTDLGRAQFAHAYDDLAVAALTFMRQQGADMERDLIVEFAKSRVSQMSARAGAKIPSDADVIARSEVIAELLSEDGFSATVHQAPNGVEICQHHCPVAHVAAAFPEFCEVETAVIGEIAGRHVQRLATIAHGDGVCTTYLPNYSPAQLSNNPRIDSKGLASQGERAR